jgi:hypothetical protein
MTKLLMISRKIIAAYSENFMEQTNTLCGENGEYFNFRAGGRLRIIIAEI